MLWLLDTGHHGHQPNRYPRLCAPPTGTNRPKDRVPPSRPGSTSLHPPDPLQEGQSLTTTSLPSPRAALHTDTLPARCLLARPTTRSQMSLQRGINFRALAEKMGNCSGAEGESSTTCWIKCDASRPLLTRPPLPLLLLVCNSPRNLHRGWYVPSLLFDPFSCPSGLRTDHRPTSHLWFVRYVRPPRAPNPRRRGGL